METDEGDAAGFDFDTLDEPVTTTILRDVKMVFSKFLQVLMPHKKRVDVLRNWDMWGPLVLCVTLAFLLRSNIDDAEVLQKQAIFTGTFVIIWGGAGVVTVNAQLLGGKLSFFQSVCVLGYCILPMVIASLVTIFLRHMAYNSVALDVVVAGLALAWSVAAARGFLRELHTAGRKTLALYPLFLFYFVLAYLVAVTRFVHTTTTTNPVVEDGVAPPVLDPPAAE